MGDKRMSESEILARKALALLILDIEPVLNESIDEYVSRAERIAIERYEYGENEVMV